MWGLDVALAELRREAFEQTALFLGQFERQLGGHLLQPEQALVPGEQAVALPGIARAA
ncbi:MULTISPECIES: hypothetical protein [Pannonibacter]|uniref:hypothetical protein n=1 Tax=Pannonibacter TaxID=227873 RepID=UPI0013DDEAB7|nr:hypothetical protein [Pannonibacter phragmitetus]